MSYSQFEFESDLESGFEERFADYIDTVARERRTDDEGKLIPLPEYWEDTISELADDAIPAYNSEIVALWLDMNLPEIEDPGLVDGETDVLRIITIVLYEQANNYLWELANKYGFYN